jgi:hypothetical protein
MSEVNRITHHINGAYWKESATRSGDVYNPATGRVTAKVDFATPELIDHGKSNGLKHLLLREFKFYSLLGKS